MSPSPFDKEFARFAGELAESLSFNKSIGQIFGLLYLSETPLCLDDIAVRLSMSKGNASINLRYLESWGAVKPVAVSGTRRDHYEANTNLKDLATKRIREGIGRRLDLAQERLEKLTPSSPRAAQKIDELRSMIAKMKTALSSLEKIMLFVGKF